MTASANRVHFDKDTMTVDLTDGRTVSVPLAWFPRLLRATPAQRAKVELSRLGLHWEELDEDISIAGLLAGRGDQTKPVEAIASKAPIPAEAKQGSRDTRFYVERRPQGDYAVRRANSERASDVLPTQRQAIERARELSPGSSPHVERVRKRSSGAQDKWRKT
jgi:hypothetical protein